jgi:hypothetical protein
METEKRTAKRKKDSGTEDLRKKKEKRSKDADRTSFEPVQPTKSETKKKKRKRDDAESTSESKKKSKKIKSLPIDPEEIEIDISAPTPPSKKALRLQKKGKPVPKLSSTSQPPTSLVPAPSNDEDIHPDRKKLLKEIPRAEWSVWIGNLAYKSDVKALRGWLVRTDKRVADREITRIHLPLNADGQSKGYETRCAC